MSWTGYVLSVHKTEIELNDDDNADNREDYEVKFNLMSKQTYSYGKYS